jgi:AcrR family transcriptional regulator
MPKPRPQKRKHSQARQAQQARSKATVNAIVEASARILAEDGWAGVNTNAIAKRAGVSVGSVYEYFRDKQGILDVIVDRHLSAAEAMLAEAASRLAAGSNIDLVVSTLVDAFMHVHSEDPALHRALSSEAPLSDNQRARIAALRAEIISLVEMALSGQVTNPRMKATLLVDTADAIAHRWLIDEVGLPVTRQAMTAEATKMLRGYCHQN